MNVISRFIVLVALLPPLGTIRGQEGSDDFPVLTGPYLGQKPPGMTPEIFAPGVVSTSTGELNVLVSTDGNEIYFCRYRPSEPTVVMVTKRVDDKWSDPEVIPFSGTFTDVDPSMSSDGNKILFGSTRPSGKEDAEGCDIWVVERLSSDKWSEPRNIGEPVNTLKNENYPTLTNKGTLYFHSEGHGGMGGLDIFRSEYENGRYVKPENLGSAINSEFNDYDAFIAPDESYLIFSSSNRPGGFGDGDLYISFKKDDGSWTKAKNMGETINTSSMELCPKLSPDGKYFFFTSDRKGSGDIYWMDAKIIRSFEPED